MVLVNSSKWVVPSNWAMAIELPNASWIQRTWAAGSMANPVYSKRRSWLSRGRNISRCSPSVTGAE
jgi:hypothetical protein